SGTRFAEAVHRGVATSNLRRGRPRDLFLPEAGPVLAAISLSSPDAQKVRHRCSARDRLSPFSVLLACLGRGKWPGCVWLCSVSATAAIAVNCVKFRLGKRMNTETELNTLDTWNDRVEKSRVLHWDGRLDNRTDLLLLLADFLRD